MCTFVLAHGAHLVRITTAPRTSVGVSYAKNHSKTVAATKTEREMDHIGAILAECEQFWWHLLKQKDISIICTYFKSASAEFEINGTKSESEKTSRKSLWSNATA